ncbi:hypothetical protein J8C06_04740 [Chloracidobacterium validum]|uniref:DUF4139 domain-containing protein n=1 Tax=Chloracidobacterium validum TaxID=2821543 RepID=A0ABX8B9Y9_9BACT|nr:hypothetical protein [Chloracidobacterium validum]QUW03743.1 hypothetical protein J8C06_04740 [Chloracidobacterium validum]
MRFLSTLVTASLLATLATAQTTLPPLPTTRLKPTSVAAFKNGLAFFIRKGQVETRQGEGYLTHIPPAALGTLWVSPTDANVALDELIAATIPVPPILEMKSAASTADLLRANVGKRVTLTLTNGKEVSGTIRAFGSPTTDALLYLEVGAGNEKTYAPFQPGDVKQAVFYERPVAQLEVARTPEGTEGNRQAALRFRFKGATGPVNLAMGYLRGGLGWTPAYRIVLEDDKTATMAMQAVVINDAEDIDNAEVFFVVGFPNFAFARVISPLALQQSLAGFLSSVQRRSTGENENVMSNAIMAQRPAAYRPGPAMTDEDLAIGGAIEGAAQSEEDLFLYGRQNVTLAKGERAAYGVFSGRVSYENVYEWDVADTLPIRPYDTRPDSPPETTAEKVWHMLRLTNTLKLPWTTAPALVVRGNQPLAQEVLNYTPDGATTSLRLTLATDIRVSRAEQEVKRENDAITINRTTYSIVTIAGTLKLKNYKSTDVRMLVRKNIAGEVLSVSPNGKVERPAQAIQSVNPASRVMWEFPMKAGEEVTLSYRYKVLVN